VKSGANIKIVAYHSDKGSVKRRDDAKYVTLRIERGQMIDYLILPKVLYDLSRDEEKPVNKWEELPLSV
jgi:hypothetical protein